VGEGQRQQPSPVGGCDCTIVHAKVPMITISPLVHNSSDLAGACCQPCTKPSACIASPTVAAARAISSGRTRVVTCPAAGASSGGVSVAVAVCPASGPVSVVSMDGAESSTARQRSKGGLTGLVGWLLGVGVALVGEGRGARRSRGAPEADRTGSEPGPRGFCHVRVVDRRVTRLADHHPLIRRVVR
jgi:hypothetical protein